MKITNLLEYAIDYDFNFKLELSIIDDTYDFQLSSMDKNLIIQNPIIMNKSNEIIDSTGYTLILNKNFKIENLFCRSNFMNMINVLNLFSFCTDFYIDKNNDYFK